MEYNHHVGKSEGSASWCFCMSSSSDRELAGFQRNEARDMTLTFDQPQLVPAPRFEPEQPYRPSHHSQVSSESSHKTRSRSSSLARLSRPWTSQSKTRPSISAPMDFRRVTEPLPSRRRSFRPLELSIYMPSGRISPLPDFDSDEWTAKLPQLQRPEAAILRRETMDNSDIPNEIRRKPLSASNSFNLRREITSEPFLAMDNGLGRVVRRDTMESEQPISDLATIDEDRTPTLATGRFEEEIPGIARPWSSRGSILNDLRMRSPSPFSISRNRSRTNPDSVSRSGSLRRSKNDTIDDAIRELNTIVEQKRVQAVLGARDSTHSVPHSPTSHVPAIAPSMKVRARSETLSDIGSAFSLSYTNKSMPNVPSPSVASTAKYTNRSPPIAPRLTIPYSPARSSDSSLTIIPASSKASTKSRLSTWLKRSLPGSPATPTAPQSFYQLTPPATAQTQQHQTAARHTRNSSSLSSDMSNISSMAISTPTSNSSVYHSASTPATTVSGSQFSPVTPDDEEANMFPLPRPSIGKTPKSLRRGGQMKRGLSIDTTLSNRSVLTGPPAYEEVDSNPSSAALGAETLGAVGTITPGRVGVAF